MSMMGQNGDTLLKTKPPDQLFPFCKIVSAINGALKLNAKNLEEIISAVSTEENLPTAAISIIGPPSSGKSFLTNLLIQYFKSDGEGGWLEQLTRKSEDEINSQKITGFLWNSVDSSSSGLFTPTDEDQATSGIYLWPEVFKREFHGGPLLVWILHLAHGENGSDADLQVLERFLMFTCSRLTEIDVKNKNFRILREALVTRDTLADADLPSNVISGSVCNSIVYLFCTETASCISKQTTDEEAKQQVSIMLQDSSNFKSFNTSILKTFKHFNIAHIKKIEGTLHEGQLKLAKNLKRPLKTIVGIITDDSEIAPRQFGQNDKAVGLLDFAAFLHSCVKDINSLSSIIYHHSFSRTPAVLYSTSKHLAVASELPASPSISEAKTEEGSFSILQNCINNEMIPVIESSINGDAGLPMLDPLRNEDTIVKQNTDEKRGNPLKQIHPKLDCRQRKNGQCNYTTASNTTMTKSLLVDTPASESHELDKNSLTGCVSHAEAKTPSEIKECHDDQPNTKATPSLISPPKLKIFNFQEHQPQIRIIPLSEPQQQETGPVTTPREKGVPSDDAYVDTCHLDRDSCNQSDEVTGEVPINKHIDVEMEIDGECRSQSTTLTMDSHIEMEPEEKQKLQHFDDKAMETKKLTSAQVNHQAEHLLGEQADSRAINAGQQQLLVLKSRFFKTASQWLQSNLLPTNILDIEHIFKELLKKVVVPDAQESMLETLDKSIEEEFEKFCTTCLDVVKDRLQIFYRTMKKKFEFLDCFTVEELSDVANEEYKQITHGIESPEISSLVEIGYEKLMNYFRDQNQKIIVNEKKLALEFQHGVKQFYNEEMKRFMSDVKFYDPVNLKEIHSHLVTKLINSFQTAFRLTSRETICENVELILKSLETSLNDDFAQFVKANMENLKAIYAKISEFQKESTSAYSEKMDAELQQNPDGLDVQILQTKEWYARNEILKLFEINIKHLFMGSQGLDVHINTLHVQIDDLKKEVFQANYRNWQMKKSKDALERQRQQEEIRKRDLERNKQITARLAQLQQTALQGTGSGAGYNVERIPKTYPSYLDPSQLKLKPLVFELKSTSIKIGIWHDNQHYILSNEFGEQLTPLLVGLDVTGKIIYGSQVFAHSLTDGEQAAPPTPLKNRWNVTEHFIKVDQLPWNETVEFGDGETHKITVEFLLAFIFKKLKMYVEATLGGMCTVAVITIPFWFCSTQRIQVRDAGKLANFSEVYLINETSAAAFACASSSNRLSSTNNILIMSGTSERIDAFIYEYSQGPRKVKMSSHCGSQHSQKVAEPGLWKYWHAFKTVFVDLETDDVRKLCKEALRQHRSVTHDKKSKTNEFLVISESNAELEQVGREFGKRIGDVRPDFAVIFGAILLSENTNRIWERVKDKLSCDVLRKCGAEAVCKVNGRHNMLSTKYTKQTTTFPKGQRRGVFYQDMGSGLIEVGQVNGKGDFPGNLQLDVHLGISNEGIVEVKDVTFNPSTYNSWRGEISERVEYSWNTPNLQSVPEEYERLQSLLDHLQNQQLQKNIEILTTRQHLLDKCNEIKEQMKDGTIKFRTEVKKDAVTRKIEDIINATNQSAHTKEELEGMLATIVKLTPQSKHK